MKNPPVDASFFHRRRGAHLLLGVVVALVVSFYGWTVAPSQTDWGNINARGAYYNLLVEGLLVGQLNLKVDIPPGLAALPDPYDPQANHVYRTQFHLHDTSYYEGKLYIYYGITPALVLFLPYHLATGDYLYNKQAAFVFCAAGFLIGAWLLRTCWRQYFSEVSALVVAAGILTIGLASSVPLLLRTPAICEIAIGCAYAFLMATLMALWHALHAPNKGRWLATAATCFGLAVGARPSVLPGGIILLLPLLSLWRDTASAPRERRRRIFQALIGIGTPLVLVGAALAAYNYLRFADVFEFGQRYQMAGDRQDTAQHFSLGYLWFNLRAYFLATASWHWVFPYVGTITFPPLPAGHAPPESAYGVLSNTPITTLALGVVFLWTRLARPEWSRLREFVYGIAILFLSSTTLLGLFYGTIIRYQAEFTPWLALLAALGLLVIDAVIRAKRRVRIAVRLGWAACLLLSFAFVVFTSVRQLAEELNMQGVMLAQRGQIDEAFAKITSALRFKSDLAPAHSNLGQLNLNRGNPEAAIQNFAAALTIAPHSPTIHNDLGRAFVAVQKLPEAAEHFRRAVQLEPRLAIAHSNLATVLFQLGQPGQAALHYAAAIDLGLNLPGLQESLAAARQAAARSGTEGKP